ncbi:MAG: InlB B-repeat-containing protein, partial [Clostridia bacterium]|nr:InlB B-repeat-containing protein [Clostridia bacterium]
MKKFLSILLSLTLLLQCVPFGAFAEDMGSGWQGVDSDVIPFRSAGVYYTVTWVIDDEVGSYAAAEGTLLSDILPDSPTKAGYHFTGWKAGETTVDLSTATVTEDITVTAQFEEIVNKTVTFKAEGSEDVVVTVEKGTAIGRQMPDDPARDGYRFDGWFSGETEVTSATIVTDDMTVTAAFTELITVYFDSTIHDDEPGQVYKYTVGKGEALGTLPEVPENPGYTGVWAVNGETVTASTVVNESFTAKPSFTEITYTVTYIYEDGTETNVVINFVPDGHAVSGDKYLTVPSKENQEGKWVYEGTTSEFTVGTHLGGDVRVETHYEQNLFTVEFRIGNESSYQVYDTVTVYREVTLPLPSDPVKTGASFKGWFTQPEGAGTQYTAKTSITADTVLYAKFDGLVRVNFIVKDADGEVLADKSQYFTEVAVGNPVGTMPEDPFIPGQAFVKWVVEGSDPEVVVTADTVVNSSITAVAVFTSIDVYEVTVNYYYMDGTKRIDFGNQIVNITESQVLEGYSISVPSQSPVEIDGHEDIYYPAQTAVTVNGTTPFVYDQDTGVNQYKTEVEYVAASANYKVGHYLKDLMGSGYSLIPSTTEKPNPEEKVGVVHTVVTPAVRESYAFAEYESRDENVELTGEADQELKVYYARKDFTLSYNTNGGDYIQALTAKYGSSVTLSTEEEATRQGYSFDGWYLDAALYQAAGSSLVLEKDTTVYAKWTPAQVNYKIVYMIENADDDGYSFLADVTKPATTGSRITLNAATAGANGTRPSTLDTTNFTFKDSTTETVKADGTTVVTVRYNRNVYTLQGRTGTGRNASDITGATVTAKYGA